MIELIGEAVAGEAAKTRKQLEGLIDTLNKSTFDIAELLHKVKRNKFYQPDFETFTEYYQSLNLKASKAQYLEHIADVMEQVGVDRNTYEPLGTGKLREIASLNPNDTWTNPKTNEEVPMKDVIKELVEQGDKIKYPDLKRHVKTLKGFIGENDIENMTFGWIRTVMEEVIKPAIELVRRNLGSVGRDEEGNAIDASPSKCVEVMAVEYLNTQGNNVLPETVDKS